MRATHHALEQRLGLLEPPYRSRGEAQVGGLLQRSGIPFLHEYPTMVYDRGRYRVWHPDFTLPTCSSLILEYAGMPDRPDYMAGIRRKERVFAANGLPAIFAFPADLVGPRWSSRLLERIAPYLSNGKVDRTRLAFLSLR